MRGLGLPVLGVLTACGTSSSVPGGAPGADLSAFSVQRVQIDGMPFEVWLADAPALRAQGLMNARADQLAPAADGAPRGMLFSFPTDATPGFFMRSTYVPLDLAFFLASGVLLEVHPLEPFDENLVVPSAPIRYALEVPRGTLAAQGIGPGATLVLP